MNNNYYKGFYPVYDGIYFSEENTIIEQLANETGFINQVQEIKLSDDDRISITGNIVNRGFSIFDVHLFSSTEPGSLSCVVMPNFILEKTDISKLKEGFPFLLDTEDYFKLVEHLAGMILVSLRENGDATHQYAMWINGDCWGFEVVGPYESSGFSVN
ncbi:MAG: hypothetical protein CMO01_17555 [Thalassobius sp.]|nr:hypothetical protein [Thalassovita sp.]